MRLARALPPPARRSAFTMVEIAICLAVIVFGLVAIIGVLPIGINVQKDNREQTIISQDAQFFMDAIRRGDRGLDDLTNYVMAITNYEYYFDADSNFVAPFMVYGYTVSNSSVNGVVGGEQFLLTNGARIIGLLSMPRYILTNPPGNAPGKWPFRSNYVFADMRALNGPAGDTFPQRDGNIRSLSFGYRLTPEITPSASLERTSAVSLTFVTNLHEVRLQFRWPLLPVGVGNNRLSFRTLVSGSQVMDYYLPVPNETNTRPLHFFNPNNVVFAPPQ